MKTAMHPETASFRIASAIPGRVRIQFARLPRGSNLLGELSERLSALTEVQDTRIVVDAHSLIIRCTAVGPAAGEITNRIAAIAAKSIRDLQAERRGNIDAAHHEEHEARASAAYSAVPEYVVRDTLVPVQGAAALRTPARTTTTDTPKGMRPLLFSLLAIGVATLEAIPLAVAGTALALGALPLARRAVRGIRHRRLSSDQFDLVNLVVLVGIGDMLSAGQISLIINLSDYWRSRKLKHIRRKLSEVMLLEYLGRDTEAEAVVHMIENASVSNAHVENQIAKIGDRLIGPLLGAAAGTYLLTGDLLRVTSILKFSDLASDVRISAPATVISTMTAGARHGFLIDSARAMEKLAKADVVVFNAGASDLDAGAKGEREAGFIEAVEALFDRGVRRIVLPPGPAAELARAIAGRRGVSDAVTEAAEETFEATLHELRAEGFRLVILDDGMNPAALFTHIDIGVIVKRHAFSSMPVRNPRADVFLLDGDLRSLSRAIDGARETMRILEFNRGLVAVPTAISLAASVAGLSTPLVNAVIGHGAGALAGLNAIRPLLHGRKTHYTPLPTRLLSPATRSSPEVPGSA